MRKQLSNVERVATGSVDDISDAKAYAVPGPGQVTTNPAPAASNDIEGSFINSIAMGAGGWGYTIVELYISYVL